jgi:hypothetical protein
MSETTVAPVPINWEAVRMLALVVGVRESARRMGISEEAVKKRCTREGWLADPAAREIARRSVVERSGMTVAPTMVPILSPTAALNAELSQLGSKTKLGIARGLARASEVIGEMGGVQVIDNAHEIKSVAQTADLVHGWKDSAPQVKIRLDVLSGSADAQPIDIEATEIPSGSASWAEDSVDPLDEY